MTNIITNNAQSCRDSEKFDKYYYYNNNIDGGTSGLQIIFTNILIALAAECKAS